MPATLEQCPLTDEQSESAAEFYSMVLSRSGKAAKGKAKIYDAAYDVAIDRLLKSVARFDGRGKLANYAHAMLNPSLIRQDAIRIVYGYCEDGVMPRRHAEVIAESFDSERHGLPEEFASFESIDSADAFDSMIGHIEDPFHADVMRAYFEHDLSTRDIAAAVGCGRSKIQEIIRHGIETIRHAMDGGGSEESTD